MKVVLNKRYPSKFLVLKCEWKERKGKERKKHVIKSVNV